MSENETSSNEPKPWFKKKIVWVAGAIVLLIGIGASQGGSKNNLPVSDPTSDSTIQTPEETQEPVVEETEEPVVEETEEPVVEEPTETISQSNAVSTALDYIEYSSFSRSGLIDQLKFEGYSSADATYAVDAIDVDWNEQAAKTAQDYLDSSSFSRSGLYDQLIFEGFTSSQANYGLSAVGY